jgi:hypothetical protein
MWYRIKTASPIDEDMSEFGYKDIIKTDDNITEKELLDNIKDFYIRQVTSQSVHEDLKDPQYKADFMEELHLMWDEYIEDIKKGNRESLAHVLNIITNYNSLLPDGSKEKEMLTELLSSGKIATLLTRHA